MALVSGYKYDVFISYVHDDNKPEITGDDGWVDQFYKYLETKLNKHNKAINIFWDERSLDRSELFDKKIIEALNESAVLLCLYSRRYTQSVYCVKELEHFYKKVQSDKAGLSIENRSRILPVMLSNIPYVEWPDKLSGTSSFKFHDAVNEEDYGDPLQVSTQGLFSDEAKRLRTEVIKTLEAFSKIDVISDDSKDLVIPSGKDKPFTIYFGEVIDSLYDRREGIVVELESIGFNIILGDNSSTDYETHQKISKEAIDKAKLAVHLLGNYPGKKIKGATNDKRYQQQQVEIGFESTTPQLIWMDEELDVSTVSNKVYAEFLKRLGDSTHNSKNYEYVLGNEGNLAKVILDHANRLKEEIISKQAKGKNNGVSSLKVLLDTHIDDFKDAFNLKKILTEYNIQPIFNPEDGDPQKNITSLYNNIREANKFIFLYGNEDNKDWVDIRVKNTLKKLMEYDRFSKDVFIYVAPPQKNPEVIQSISIGRSPLVEVLNFSDKPTIDGELLVQYLNDKK